MAVSPDCCSSKDRAHSFVGCVKYTPSQIVLACIPLLVYLRLAQLNILIISTWKVSNGDLSKSWYVICADIPRDLCRLYSIDFACATRWYSFDSISRTNLEIGFFLFS